MNKTTKNILLAGAAYFGYKYLKNKNAPKETNPEQSVGACPGCNCQDYPGVAGRVAVYDCRKLKR